MLLGRGRRLSGRQPGASPQTADPACASGRVVKSGADWAAQVRAMYPAYKGPYPRMATWHGHADTFVSYLNLDEQIKEWRHVLDVAYVKNVTDTPQRGYTRWSSATAPSSWPTRPRVSATLCRYIPRRTSSGSASSQSTVRLLF